MNSPPLTPCAAPASAPRRRTAERAPALLGLALALAGAGCRSAALPLADAGPAALQRRSDDFFGALTLRFGDVRRTPRLQHARERLEQNALTPSRVFDDTSIWTARPTPALRTLTIGGAAQSEYFRMWSDARVPRPTHPADSRHLITLTSLGEDQYRWTTHVDFSLGAVGAETVAAVVAGLPASAAAGAERDLRADYRATFPRTAAALGLLANIDTLRSLPLADGSRSTTLVVLLDAERLARRFPALGDYLKRYVHTGRYQFALRDASGAIWMLASARDDRMRFQFRTVRGALAPLGGGTRALPDTLLLDGEIYAKVKIFTVGMSKLSLDVVRTHDAHEATWSFIARRQPEWHLPLATARLLRAPLARPFQGSGALFQIGVRDVDGQTMLFRRAELAVQESAILRFLGRMSATLMGDFNGRVEEEQDRFLHEVFQAMWADARAL